MMNTSRNKSRIVITVDGLAGSGKTSLSRALAEKLGFTHFSSGALYRSLALLALRSKKSPDDSAALCRLLAEHRIELMSAGGRMQVLLDEQDITGDLSGPEVSEATSRASQLEEVRLALIDKQRAAFSGSNLVAEGRDMGTVIFPDSPLKFFVVVPEEVRVERRLNQLLREKRGAIEGGSAEDRDNLLKKMKIEITERDLRDSVRIYSPTKPAEDAVIVNNFGQTLTEVVEHMYHLVLERHLLD